MAGGHSGRDGRQHGGSAQTALQDTDILNFALNLEYLEAEFYTIATTGQNISQAGIGTIGTGASGNTTGGAQVTFTDGQLKALAAELAFDEQSHVTLLRNAITSLGGQPVAKPAINLAAPGYGFANPNDFLKLARVFEDIGVTAYAGAAPLIQNRTALGYAARILGVEAMHSGAIRAAIAAAGIATTPVDGADHVPPPTGTQYFNTDSNALVETRTPQQVLFLAYGAAGVSLGGFFPSGVNGAIVLSGSGGATTDGASITATPNPIPVSGAALGMTTISWNAPGASISQLRIGSPSGSLLTDNFPTGSMQTGPWVTDGMTFYLQDVSNGKPLTSTNTLATVVVHLTQN